MNNLLKQKQPYISDIKEFLMVAKLFGFTLCQSILRKKVIYPNNSELKIMINLYSGLIVFECFENNILTELSLDDKRYLMREFEHYVDWK